MGSLILWTACGALKKSSGIPTVFSMHAPSEGESEEIRLLELRQGCTRIQWTPWYAICALADYLSTRPQSQCTLVRGKTVSKEAWSNALHFCASRTSHFSNHVFWFTIQHTVHTCLRFALRSLCNLNIYISKLIVNYACTHRFYLMCLLTSILQRPLPRNDFKSQNWVTTATNGAGF